MAGIYEEHLNEACFLWWRWEGALRSERHDMRAVVALEGRLLAHLDGLVVGGEPVIQEFVKPVLEVPETREHLSVAAFVWLAGSGQDAVSEVFQMWRSAPEGLESAYQRALELCGRPGLEKALLAGAVDGDGEWNARVLEVLAFRGAIPNDFWGPQLLNADARAQVAVLRALRPPPGKLLEDVLRRLLAHEEPEIRLAAMEAGLVAGSHAAWDACRQEVRRRGEALRGALVLLALCGDEKDVVGILPLLGEVAWREGALWALGFSGRMLAADSCLEMMRQPARVARLAGEAFSSITGLALDGGYALATPDEDALPPLEEEDLDADLVPKPEDGLPVPAPEATARWWSQARKGFSTRGRWLRGQPANGGALLDVLEHGAMRRRRTHALELALRSKGALHLQARAFSDRQRRELERIRSACVRLPVAL
ncbi:TIGR02270 family protein [Pyxidicoccus caerfyrddinensis]|uniref:TIGR02270 family protein n=1 Tax=Pyxidicoccus caerfyrddinensis TaxID=2709663 RepID=UPI0013D9AC39|nr:TIGR02270 family protein [Pyxidicoccus caerfyrddinensis]